MRDERRFVQIGDRDPVRELTRREVLSLPMPTAAQLEEFAQHVCWAHSWYKHLSILTGGEFIFFLAKDAGMGFTAESPRLHYSWTTTAEYRNRFGYLDYAHRGDPQESFRRDAEPTGLRLPVEVAAATRTILFPYVSTDFNAREACLWGIHVDDLPILRAGGAYPARDQVLEWHATQQRISDMWDELSKADQDIFVKWDSVPETDDPTWSEPLTRAAGAERAARETYWRLQHAELAKIHAGLEALLRLVEQWKSSEDSTSAGQ